MDLQKRKKNWFSDNQRKRKQTSMEAGMKGFLCTCNFREKDCVRDIYKLLNEFSDKLNNKEKSENEDLPKEGESNADDEDISAALNKEISQLQAESKPGQQRKFQVTETKVKNVIFIQTTVPDPLPLAMSIIKEIYETKNQRSRFLLRLLPIEFVCRANMDDLKSNADKVLEKYFAQEPKTFSIIFNRHSNSNIERGVVIEDIASIISAKNPGNKADLKNPEIAVIIEALRGFCLLSVAPNYMLYKKYNLMEMCNPSTQKNGKKSEENAESVDSKNDDPVSENTEEPVDTISENTEIAVETEDNSVSENSEPVDPISENTEKDVETKENSVSENSAEPVNKKTDDDSVAEKKE